MLSRIMHYDLMISIDAFLNLLCIIEINRMKNYIVILSFLHDDKTGPHHGSETQQRTDSANRNK